jgi:hypothetical protein
MLRVKIRYDGKYRLILRRTANFNDTYCLVVSDDKRILMPIFKSIRRNWYKNNKSIYF